MSLLVDKQGVERNLRHVASLSFSLKKSLSCSYLLTNSQIERPFFLERSYSWTLVVFNILLVRDVKHIKALFLIDQLSDLKFSTASIMAGVTNFPISCFSRASWKINLMMFKAWILESSSSVEVLARLRRNSKV